jgi:hypothetical protein
VSTQSTEFESTLNALANERLVAYTRKHLL